MFILRPLATSCWPGAKSKALEILDRQVGSGGRGRVGLRAAQRVSSAREVSDASRREAHAKLAPKGKKKGLVGPVDALCLLSSAN